MTAAFFNDDQLEIETSPLTLVFNTTHGESRYPGRFAITAENSLEHFAFVSEIHRDAAAMFRVVVPDFEGEVSKASLSKCQPCFRRLAGMLDLTVRLLTVGVPIVWKYPEDGLHPRYQANLADVMISLAKGGKS
jgi:hypothetical protein